MRPKVAIITDTTACIPPQLVQQHGIGLVAIQFIIEGKSYRDGIDMTPAQFYEFLGTAVNLPTTAGSLPGPYLEAFQNTPQGTTAILCVTEPSKLSGMYNSARLAAKMAAESLPGVTIEVMECSCAAAGQGLVVLAAARAAADGKALEEVVATARKVMQRTYLYATLDTLKYLAKGGRVPKAAELVNSIIHIKPIFSVSDGEVQIVGLPRSIESATKRILGLMKKAAAAGGSLHVAVMHAAVPKLAEQLKKRIEAGFRLAEIYITEFTPVMGVHTGPGVIGAAFYAGDGL